jgi:hypothetical protein
MRYGAHCGDVIETAFCSGGFHSHCWSWQDCIISDAVAVMSDH